MISPIHRLLLAAAWLALVLPLNAVQYVYEFGAGINCFGDDMPPEWIAEAGGGSNISLRGRLEFDVALDPSDPSLIARGATLTVNGWRGLRETVISDLRLTEWGTGWFWLGAWTIGEYQFCFSEFMPESAMHSGFLESQTLFGDLFVSGTYNGSVWEAYTDDAMFLTRVDVPDGGATWLLLGLSLAPTLMLGCRRGFRSLH